MSFTYRGLTAVLDHHTVTMAEVAESKDCRRAS